MQFALEECDTCGKVSTVHGTEYRSGGIYCTECAKNVPKSRIQMHIEEKTKENPEFNKLYGEFFIHFDEIIQSGKEESIQTGHVGELDAAFMNVEDKAIAAFDAIMDVCKKAKEVK